MFGDDYAREHQNDPKGPLDWLLLLLFFAFGVVLWGGCWWIAIKFIKWVWNS
jgi:hypothetical protein